MFDGGHAWPGQFEAFGHGGLGDPALLAQGVQSDLGQQGLALGLDHLGGDVRAGGADLGEALQVLHHFGSLR